MPTGGQEGPGHTINTRLVDLQVGMTAISSLKGTLIDLLLSIVMWSFFLIFQYLGSKALPIDI